MTLRPFRWLPHDGKRHAIPENLVVGDTGETLCGKELAVPHDRPTKTAWCWPTCADCDTSWRQREGILPFPRPASSGRRVASRAVVRR